MTIAMPWCAARSQRIGFEAAAAGRRPPEGRSQPFGVGSATAGQVAFTRPGRSGSAPVARYRFR